MQENFPQCSFSVVTAVRLGTLPLIHGYDNTVPTSDQNCLRLLSTTVSETHSNRVYRAL